MAGGVVPASAVPTATGGESRPVSRLSRAARGAASGRAYPRERLGEIWRARIVAATMQAVCEEGAGNVTVAGVVARAGISRRTFYELFDHIDGCLSATVEAALARAGEPVAYAWRSEPGEWRARVRAALVALLEHFDLYPDDARLLAVEWLAGSHALAQRRRVMARLAHALDEGRTVDGRAPWLPLLTADALVGGVAGVLRQRLLDRGAGGSLTELANPLMSIVVLPYLGQAAARRELERPLPTVRASRGDVARERPGELGIRVTYRTALVLDAIAANPGASNRRVAQAAGIADQGQISKLLKRLQGSGLIYNCCNGARHGQPNEWVLTDKGESLERSLRV
jgi:AcrR family transcriptional regulator